MAAPSSGKAVARVVALEEALAQDGRQALDKMLAGASEQSAGVQQVGESLQALDQQTQQNAALVEQTAAAASSLRDPAVSLVERVARFQLPH